jgi:hypothetical protein
MEAPQLPDVCLLVASSLFQFLDEEALFSRPTFAALVALLDNYQRVTGQDEDFSPQQLAEQEAFVRETMSKTALGRKLYAFLSSKGTALSSTFVWSWFGLDGMSPYGSVWIESSWFGLD